MIQTLKRFLGWRGAVAAALARIETQNQQILNQETQAVKALADLNQAVADVNASVATESTRVQTIIDNLNAAAGDTVSAADVEAAVTELQGVKANLDRLFVTPPVDTTTAGPAS